MVIMKENKLSEDNEKKFDALGFRNNFLDTIAKDMLHVRKN